MIGLLFSCLLFIAIIYGCRKRKTPISLQEIAEIIIQTNDLMSELPFYPTNKPLPGEASLMSAIFKEQEIEDE